MLEDHSITLSSQDRHMEHPNHHTVVASQATTDLPSHLRQSPGCQDCWSRSWTPRSTSYQEYSLLSEGNQRNKITPKSPRLCTRHLPLDMELQHLGMVPPVQVMELQVQATMPHLWDTVLQAQVTGLQHLDMVLQARATAHQAQDMMLPAQAMTHQAQDTVLPAQVTVLQAQATAHPTQGTTLPAQDTPHPAQDTTPLRFPLATPHPPPAMQLPPMST